MSRFSYVIVLLFLLFSISLFADFGNCLQFDGVDDYCFYDSNDTESFSEVTLEVWVYHTSLGTGIQRYITLGNENAVIRKYGDDQLHFYVKQSNGALASLYVDNCLETNVWTHVAGTYDGTTLKIYKNGELVGSNTASVGGMATVDVDIKFGYSGENFAGKMDDARIWRDVRTQSEIQDNMYSSINCFINDGFDYWKFDRSSGTEVWCECDYDIPMYNFSSPGCWVNSTVPEPIGEKGNALNFDGNDEYVIVNPVNDFPTDQINVSCWIKTSDTSNTGVPLSYASSGNTNDFLIYDYGNLAFQVGGVSSGTTGVSLNDGDWHYLSVNWRSSDGTLEVYKDGVQEYTGTVNQGGSITSGGALVLGQDQDSIGGGFETNQAFIGVMEELSIWSTFRSSQEINENMYTYLAGTEQDLVSYYRFNTGSEIIAYDLTSFNHGHLMNMESSDWVTSDAPLVDGIYGAISSNTTWSGTVNITGDITVNDGVTLTIDSGTNIVFYGHYEIDVDGNIEANGTSGNNILFTANGSLTWNRIEYFNTSSYNDDSYFDYCIFEKSHADGVDHEGEGGAVFIWNYDDVSFNNCIFRDNIANEDGGGVFITYESDIDLTDCQFIDNSAVRGGGLYSGTGCSIELERCIFNGNSCSSTGAGLYSSAASLTMKNCLLYENISSNDCGGAYIGGSTAMLYNCTIADNSASNSGGGIEVHSSGLSAYNCLLYDNAASHGDQVYLGAGSDPDFYYCNIQGGTGGFYGDSYSGTYQNCIDFDPDFTDAANDDYTLQPLSHCINMGDPSTTTNDAGSFDLTGNDRFLDQGNYNNSNLEDQLDRIDIGAYENQELNGIIPDDTTISGSADAFTKLTILTDYSITINAGSTLSFGDESELDIYGEVDANGFAGSFIIFQPYDESVDYRGLNFKNSSGTTTSTFDYCKFSGAKSDSRSEDWGGNIHSWYYEYLYFNNCIFSEGESSHGGGLYIRGADDASFKNCVFYNNYASTQGGALYVNNAYVHIYNCTFSDNNAALFGAFRFNDCTSKQPVIRNTIIWNNGENPIELADGSFTDLQYCNIEGGYTGTGNLDFEPDFVGTGDHPYTLHAGSIGLNMGTPDASGLNLPATDPAGHDRIFSHTTPSYDRIDMGAYETQSLAAPYNVVASDGNSAYPGYVQLSWDFHADYEPAPVQFRIFRDDVSINYIDGQTFSYSDYNAVPGQFHNYYIQTSTEGQTGDSRTDTGYVKPNGVISGTVLTANNNPVQDVQVTIDPSTGNCLRLESTSSSLLTIEDPEVDMNYNFTLEVWVRSPESDVTILNKGDLSIKINASGEFEYTDGTSTISQDSLTINDNEWHHLVVVNDFTNSQTLLYVDENIVNNSPGILYSGISSGNIISDTGFTGYLDDIRFWSTARTESEILNNMNIVSAIDELGLAGYWTFNEGNGNIVFDATDYSHNGEIQNCSWSDLDADIAQGAITDQWGNYIIQQIAYGTSTTFEVIPYKQGHIFQPELRYVTLNTSNTAQNSIDFTDNSLIPISGQVIYQNTECPVVGASILLNGVPSSPITLTDDEGYFVMEVEHGTECILSVDFEEHIFNREWHLGEVTFPQVNIDFEDTFKTGFRCEVVGGNDHYPIGDFTVTLQSVDGCYSDEITGSSWSNGGININSLPPLDYNVTVDPEGTDYFSLAVDDQFQNMNTQMISLAYPDSTLDTLRFVWRAPLEISVEWPDTLDLNAFSEYPESEFYVLPQNEWVDVEIQAIEDYSFEQRVEQISYLTDCDILINDEVGTTGEMNTNFNGSNVYTHHFAPYLPNILAGYDRQYQNMIEFTVYDNDLNRYATQTDWVFTEGVKPLESTYATTAPEIPFLILHDPPGDGSFSSFTENHSHSIKISASVESNDQSGSYRTMHLGPDIITETGFLFSVETHIDLTADFESGLSVQTVQNESTSQELTFRTTQGYSTSSDDQVIGDGSDLFVGGAMNLIWGVTNELSWDDINQEAIIDSSVMVTPNGFETVYIYTDNQIRNTVIPNLYAIEDTTAAELWQSYLDMNEDNKTNAVTNPNHPSNLSFNAGASYFYEEETTTTRDTTFTFDTIVDEDFGRLIGASVNGVGVENGWSFSTKITTSADSTETFETTTTTSFTLADDDETSALNDLADYFSVNVKTDPVYGTPVFELVSGATSCPWEENTQPREGVSLTANTYTANGLLIGEEAAFILTLGNTSQTSEDRRYYLTVKHGTNPGGAIIKINGVPLEERMAFDVSAGEAVQAIMTVAQGPYDYEYDDLTLEFYSECDRGNTGPEDHYFSMEKSFDVTWEAPYSRISIDTPKDNWIVNQANNDTLDIRLKDYDINKPDFKSVKLQYKHPEDDNWYPAFEIFKDSLLAHPIYIEIPWDVSGIPDGIYQIRAATTDSLQADYYTESLLGVVDRISPEVMGTPEPADDILEYGDEISVTFAEQINCTNLDENDITVTIINGGQLIAFDFDCYENTIEITPMIANYWFENETIEVQVENVYDLYGNVLETPVTWEFYVNSNPVNWNVTHLDVIKPIGNPMTLSANLINSGGQSYSYVFTDYPDSLYHQDLQYHVPDWLTITPTSGQLIPLDTQEINFEISDQIGFGHYETTIFAHTAMGNEAILIEVDVLSDPPDWTLTDFNDFQSSMSIIAELDFEGTLSDDTNDIIGAFMENETGEWECRGVANVESVPYIPTHPYQVFLTIYSDLADPVRAEDEVIFKLWDHSENKEYYQIDHASAFGGTLMYQVNSVYGSPMTPITLSTVTDLVQDIPLTSGWTWFSTNLTLIPDTINDVLSSLNPAEDDYIKNQTQYAQYFTDQWVGSLTTMDNTNMYKINLTEAQTLEIIGELRDPLTTTFTYTSGWNWLGYIPHVSMSVNHALSERTNITGDFIKNQNGYAFYVDASTGWIGSLRFMNPGEGFMLYANAGGSFEYTEYDIRFDDSIYPQHNVTELRNAPDWSVNPQDYEYTASVTIELAEATHGNYLVGAFVDEECRGNATSIYVNDTWLYFLTVYSNTQNQEMSIKLYDGNLDTISESPDTFTFQNDIILGTPSQPFEVNILGQLTAPENVQLEVIGDEVQLSWQEVTGANSYKIFASDKPDGTFVEVTGKGTFGRSGGVILTENEKSLKPINTVNVLQKGTNRATQTWTASIDSTKKFYYVQATAESESRNLSKHSKNSK